MLVLLINLCLVVLSVGAVTHRICGLDILVSVYLLRLLWVNVIVTLFVFLALNFCLGHDCFVRVFLCFMSLLMLLVFSGWYCCCWSYCGVVILQVLIGGCQDLCVDYVVISVGLAVVCLLLCYYYIVVVVVMFLLWYDVFMCFIVVMVWWEDLIGPWGCFVWVEWHSDYLIIWLALVSSVVWFDIFVGIVMFIFISVVCMCVFL